MNTLQSNQFVTFHNITAILPALETYPVDTSTSSLCLSLCNVINIWAHPYSTWAKKHIFNPNPLDCTLYMRKNLLNPTPSPLLSAYVLYGWTLYCQRQLSSPIEMLQQNHVVRTDSKNLQ